MVPDYYILTCYRHASAVDPTYVALKTLAVKAWNEGGESEMYKRANNTNNIVVYSFNCLMLAGEFPFKCKCLFINIYTSPMIFHV